MSRRHSWLPALRFTSASADLELERNRMSTALSMEDTARKKAQEKPQTPFRFIERDKLKGRSAGTMLPSRTDFVGRFNIKRIGENSSYIYLEDAVVPVHGEGGHLHSSVCRGGLPLLTEIVPRLCSVLGDSLLHLP